MKKRICCGLLVVLMVVLCGCANYRKADFLGKTSAQIEQQYGLFDCIEQPKDEDGLYRNTDCGYTIKEKRVGFLDAIPEELFFIRFNENGVAVSCFEGYRPGG